MPIAKLLCQKRHFEVFVYYSFASLNFFCIEEFYEGMDKNNFSSKCHSQNSPKDRARARNIFRLILSEQSE